MKGRLSQRKDSLKKEISCSNPRLPLKQKISLDIPDIIGKQLDTHSVLMPSKSLLSISSNRATPTQMLPIQLSKKESCTPVVNSKKYSGGGGQSCKVQNRKVNSFSLASKIVEDDIAPKVLLFQTNSLTSSSNNNNDTAHENSHIRNYNDTSSLPDNLVIDNVLHLKWRGRIHANGKSVLNQSQKNIQEKENHPQMKVMICSELYDFERVQEKTKKNHASQTNDQHSIQPISDILSKLNNQKGSYKEESERLFNNRNTNCIHKNKQQNCSSQTNPLHQQQSVKFPLLNQLVPSTSYLVAHGAAKKYLHRTAQSMSQNDVPSISQLKQALVISRVVEKQTKCMRNISVQSNDEEHLFETDNQLDGVDSKNPVQSTGQQEITEMQTTQNELQLPQNQKKKKYHSSYETQLKQFEFEKGFGRKIQRHMKQSNSISCNSTTTSGSSSSVRFFNSRKHTPNQYDLTSSSSLYFFSQRHNHRHITPVNQNAHGTRQIHLSSLEENTNSNIQYHKDFDCLEDDEEDQNNDYDGVNDQNSYGLETYVREKRHIG